ncbi:hypothetical protein L218DRAFT_943114 [Marasmius fiardii PR-910]|nr:hypothetical protein L218DRAFT_943114 [Marasmius fiardii PR-910]
MYYTILRFMKKFEATGYTLSRNQGITDHWPCDRKVMICLVIIHRSTKIKDERYPVFGLTQIRVLTDIFNEKYREANWKLELDTTFRQVQRTTWRIARDQHDQRKKSGNRDILSLLIQYNIDTDLPVSQRLNDEGVARKSMLAHRVFLTVTVGYSSYSSTKPVVS